MTQQLEWRTNTNGSKDDFTPRAILAIHFPDHKRLVFVDHNMKPDDADMEAIYLRSQGISAYAILHLANHQSNDPKDCELCPMVEESILGRRGQNW
jgi:hypothetical protein